MTAEIAVINRSAVTLAADSAMTLSVRGAEKIYTSTDKIFELSNYDPIGIMIFNNLEYMQVPLDVAIKHFRNTAYCRSFHNVKEAAEAFFKYLVEAWPASNDLQKNHARALISPVFRIVRRKFEKSATDAYARHEAANKGGRKRFNLYNTFLTTLQEELSCYEDLPPAACFDDISEDQIGEIYSETLTELINQNFRGLPLDQSDYKLLTRLGILLLHRNTFSSSFSGLVFSGFGSDDMFPSLQAYNIDGIIAGRLKIEETESEVASRETVSAKIVPFAQREVVDRFLHGLDPEMEEGIYNYLKIAMDHINNHIFNNVINISKSNKEKIIDNLRTLTDTVEKFLADEYIPGAKKKFSQQTEDMVLFMAKQELANLAEALVNITSTKRKFSAEKETVGGPIDVAVISKNDGFVWVRRKHYFKPELNPRYFARKHAAQHATSGGEHAARGDQDAEI